MATARILRFEMPKKTIELSEDAVRILLDLKDRLGVRSQTAAMELALRHLSSTLDRGDGVFVGGERTAPKPKSA